ncbi:MAG: LytTR family DNA-binding domain-containing protein [Gammaproteobacteria bacterium]|jgi:two-component system response regulator AlgR
MRILIVDDERPARQRLVDQIGDMPDHEVAGQAAGGSEALALCRDIRPDVVLLDIRMPGMDGIETARHLADLATPPAIIFTTAYDEYALQAFEAQAVGYLLKPIRRHRLGQALERAARLTGDQLSGIAGAGGRRRYLCARAGDELRLIPVCDIYYFRADRKYVRACHAGGEDLLDDSLKSLEEEFAPDFCRIHRNALVALEHLSGLESDTEGKPVVRFRRTGETLPVSRRHVGEIRQRLKGGIR